MRKASLENLLLHKQKETGADQLCGSATLFSLQSIYHYANIPMQYTAIFHGGKNDNFQMKNSDNFLMFCSNIDRGYTLGTR